MNKLWQAAWVNRGWTVRVAAILVVAVLLGIGGRSCYSRFSSSAYWKSSKEYKDEKAAWDKERAGLQALIRERDAKIAEAEPKVIAFDALAAQHKAADPKLVQQIEEVSKDEANKVANAEQPSDCASRVRRICDLLRARDPKYDCGKLTRESCAGQ